MTAPPSTPDFATIRTFGRRRGRGLRANRSALLDALLPRIAIDPAADRPIEPRALYDPPPGAMWLEIGFGAGEHLAAQAGIHPTIGFIGCEAYTDGVASLLRHVRDGCLDNVRIFAADARALLPRLPRNSIQRVDLLFPDPWPKARHHKRRFIQSANVDALARVMADDASLWFASDCSGYAGWTLAIMDAHPSFSRPARTRADWCRPADWIPTRYEGKALARKDRCYYLQFVRRARNGAPLRHKELEFPPPTQ